MSQSPAADTAVPAEQAPAHDPRGRLPLENGRRPDGRFRPGASGNPHGRPRRAALASAAARRLIPVEPTELELALAEPVMCLVADATAPVPLARAVVARLTERALDGGDIAACRELLRLCAEADAVRIERDLLLAERDAEEAQAEVEEARARQAAEREARALAHRTAQLEIAALAEAAASDAGEIDLDPAARALKLLEAVDEASGDEIEGLSDWVEAAARAQDPALPRGARPLDPADPWGVLDRLGIAFDEDGETRLAGWFIDAARARRPDVRFEPGDEALLQWVRAEGDEDADWVARWAVVEAAMRTVAE